MAVNIVFLPMALALCNALAIPCDNREALLQSAMAAKDAQYRYDSLLICQKSSDGKQCPPWPGDECLAITMDKNERNEVVAIGYLCRKPNVVSRLEPHPGPG